MDDRRPNKLNRYTYARHARVQRVDYENWVVDLSYESSTTGQPEVPINVAFSTPRAIIAGMPEVGSSMLTDFTQSGTHAGKAATTTYYPAGFKAGLNLRKQFHGRNKAEGYLETLYYRRKFRKIYPGEIIMSSTYGSDFISDENQTITGMKGDEIRLDYRDQSINSISIQNYQITDASRISNGWVSRYVPESYNEDGSVLPSDFVGPDPTQPLITDESGKKRFYRTLAGDRPVDLLYLDDDFYASPLVEHRTELREIGYGLLPLVDQNTDKDLWSENNTSDTLVQRRGNLIESTSGTLVGSDINHPNYGRVLMPKIFLDVDGTGLDIRETPVLEGQAPDYTPVRMHAAAFSWKMPFEYAQTRMYVTKEGHVQAHVGATTELEEVIYSPKLEHDNGAGRSVDVNFGGSIKAVVDKNRKREESLDLKTLGKVYFHFGKDDGVPSGTRRNLSIDNGSYSGAVAHPQLTDAVGATASAKHISIEGVTDGGIVLRVGRNQGRNLRNFEKNGFNSNGSAYLGTKDVRDVGRDTYGEGDVPYRHHDLRQVGLGRVGRLDPRKEDEEGALPVGGPISDPDYMATSLDAHLVGSAFGRVGKDADGNSIILDTAGSLVAWLGAESQNNRSITATLDGGIEAKIGRMNTTGASVHATLEGGILIDLYGGNGEFKDADGNIRGTSDFNITARGNRSETQIGNIRRDIQGDKTDSISANKISTVGFNASENVGKNKITQVTEKMYTTIGGSTDGDAVKEEIFVGNKITQITTKGDIKMETRMGKIDIQTLLGNAEFKTMVGDIVLSTLAGNVNVQATGKVKCGKPVLPKYGVVTNFTGCILTGGALPHTFGSMDVLASQITPVDVPIPEI